MALEVHLRHTEGLLYIHPHAPGAFGPVSRVHATVSGRRVQGFQEG